MRIRLHEKFDEVWLQYNNGKASRKEWDKALDNWLRMEQI
jgi:hypothetical protein